jgi:hypothetical protein
MEKQRRISSLIESVSSTIVGLIVATLLQLIVFPWFGVNHLSTTQNIEIALIFMTVGAIRGYIWRRAFEWLRVTGILP